MKVSTYIAQFLVEKEIDLIFELQGGMITRLIDEIYRAGKVKIVSMHHEQAASFAADAYGRIKNKPGIALATSGPGATNLITGLGCCYFDSVPAIFITGQVNNNELKGDKITRQIGFQETDIVSIVQPITKKAFFINSSAEIPLVLEEAYQISISGRPGPVLIDIPMNIQNEEILSPTLVKTRKTNHQKVIDVSFYENLMNALKGSKRPLILAGRGVRTSGSIKSFRKFIQHYQIPVVTSLLGLDVVDYNHLQRIGFIGTYGNRWANYALGTCDLLIVLGSRLDIRQTGVDTKSFQLGKKIFHVDIDEAELNNRLKDCKILNCDLLDFFEYVEKSTLTITVSPEWINEIAKFRKVRSDIAELDNIVGINPNVFIHRLSQTSSLAYAYTTDVGNNQMWSAQSLELTKTQHFLTSGGMGAMGYALPAAIGASLSFESKPVVAIAGDGGFQINIQELQTIKRNNLPVKIVILNNHCLGMIRQFQDSYFKSCYQSTVWGYNAPDFLKIARAYDIDSFRIERDEDIESGLQKLWEYPYQPFLLEVNIDIHTNVFPKMMFGSPITQMEPVITKK